MILEVCEDIYQENPMMVISALLLTLLYAYYRLEVVQVPVLYCRPHTRLHQ